MVTIRTAAAADASAVGELLGEAFRDDPTWAMYFPDPATRADKLSRYYRRKVLRHPDRVDVAIDDGRVLGALFWAPPESGSWLAAVERAGSRAWLWFLSRLPSGRGARHTRAVQSHLPAEPHWYFHDIASGPDARGKGIGSALLQNRLEIIDRSGPVAVCLESTTPGSRRLYERFGFRALASVTTQPGQASTVMLRQPAV